MNSHNIIECQTLKLKTNLLDFFPDASEKAGETPTERGVSSMICQT